MRAAGLDLGQGRAAFVRLKASGTTVRLEAAALVDLDAAADEGARAAALAGALGASARGPSPRLGVAGREAILRYLHLPNVPDWRLRLIMGVEVADVAEKAGEPLSADYRKLAIPDDIAGEETSSVLVGLAKENALLGRLGALEANGLRATAALPSSLALFDAYVGLGHVDEGKTVILVDAGPEGTELAIARDGMLVFARGLPAQRDGAPAGARLGGREAQQLAGAVASSVQFCRSQQKLRALPVDAVRVSGAYASSTELLQALRQTLKVEVTAFDPLERVDASGLAPDALGALEGRGPELAIAVGLALATAHPRCLALDLTPRPILARREFLTRTVFLYAAGALLAISLVVALSSAWVVKGRAATREKALHGLLADLERRRDALEANERDNRRKRDVVETLAKRTRSGAAALRLLARLREATPARVTIAELALEPPAPVRAAAASEPAPAAATDVVFRLRGQVDDAAGDAVVVLSRFEAALREDPAVASAKFAGTPVAQPGAILEFAMSVAMRAQAHGAEE